MVLVADSKRWEALKRPTPGWFNRAKLGFFIHWGPYSVPAWGEPIAELGTIPPQQWFKHNPYAEWYYNTIRIPGSPAAKHHQEIHGDCHYDDFLDQWQAEAFDAVSLVSQLAEAGASYLVLTTKHHDGVCLWDAPQTGDRNTVARGPKQDLVGAYVDACREVGLRFGAYYSGGLDWHIRPSEPIGLDENWEIFNRPNDSEYASYAGGHLRDLISKYQPDILWNDINWPDAGKNFGPTGIGRIFEEYYAQHREGLVNDRWHTPHADYYTSEYQHLKTAEDAQVWEHCRGVGLSFGYNQVETGEHGLSGPQTIRHLIDVVSRGGRLLLGVGPKANGQLPDWQLKVVTEIATWMKPAGEFLTDLTPTDQPLDIPGAWVRTGQSPQGKIAFIDPLSPDPVTIPAAKLLTPQWGTLKNNILTFDPNRPGPLVVIF